MQQIFADLRLRVGEVAGVAAAGDRLAMLAALRDRLAAEVDGCDDQRLLPPLVLRLTDVLAQIDAMPTSRQVSAADEIAKRRASRRGVGTAS